MGIFGFLSKAHLDQVRPTGDNQVQIALIDKQVVQQQIIIDRNQNVLDQLDRALEVYIDKEYVSRGLKERKKQKEERDLLNNEIKIAMNEIARLSVEKSGIEIEQLKIEADVGPLKYVAELIYGEEEAKEHFDKAVRLVIIILIFVFDPLAVLLLVAANISLAQWRMKRQLVKSEKKENLENIFDRQGRRLKKLVRKQRDYKKMLANFSGFKGLSPDEIKVKLDQIYDWNDKYKNN